MLPRTLGICVALTLLACGTPAVAAADYPTRPVTLVVGFTPGGASDVLARILSRKLEQILGQPFVIDNRPGAGGNVAAEAVAHAAPDGYTLFNGNNAILATNAALYKKINFNPETDFAPIGLIGSHARPPSARPLLKLGFPAASDLSPGNPTHFSGQTWTQGLQVWTWLTPKLADTRKTRDKPCPPPTSPTP